MSKKITRINALIDILKTKNGASVKDLSEILNVSEMTIRRDLKLLKENKIVNNVYGATIYNPTNQIQKMDESYEFISEYTKHDSAKESIGRCAANLIQPDETIIIDTGTTTEKMISHIKDNQNLTILCYNANALAKLTSKNISLIFAGGYFHPNTQMFESPEGIAFINRTRAHKAFISAAGVHESLGVTCAYNYELATKSAILHSSMQKILLVDASKFGVVKSGLFAELSIFDTIITDDKISPEWQNIIHNAGIELIIA